MTRNVALSALAGGLVSLVAALAVAQESAVLDDLYGRGVHAFFSRDSRRAAELLSEAIANGIKDPRAYYYRGLALRTLGREEDASLDFREGAKLEQSGDTTFAEVSKSLERVQGGVRLEIENIRRVARLQARNDRLARERARYEGIQKEDEVVLRKPGGRKPAPPAELPEATRPDATDPFGADTTEKPAVPEKPEPAETTDPAEEPLPPAKPKTTKPVEDPFGDEPAEEAPAKPKATKKPADDPFAEDPAEEPPAKPKTTKPAEDPADEAPEAEAKPDEAAAPPAAKPGKAGRSLFGALSRAIQGDDAKPVVDPKNAKDPFADDEAPAPPPKKPVPVPKKPAAGATEVEDPFK